MTTNRVILALLILTVLMQLNLTLRRSVPAGSVSEPVREAVDGTVFDLTGLPTEGAAEAPIVLVEFSDYECPFCQRHAMSVRKKIVEEYVRTGQVRYAFANNPLDMHPNAPLMATAAICAGNQGHYWEMHDRLFEQQATPEPKPALLALATDLALDMDAFGECLDNSLMPAERIEIDIARAAELGLGVHRDSFLGPSMLTAC